MGPFVPASERALFICPISRFMTLHVGIGEDYMIPCSSAKFERKLRRSGAKTASKVPSAPLPALINGQMISQNLANVCRKRAQSFAVKIDGQGAPETQKNASKMPFRPLPVFITGNGKKRQDFYGNMGAWSPREWARASSRTLRKSYEGLVLAQCWDLWGRHHLSGGG